MTLGSYTLSNDRVRLMATSSPYMQTSLVFVYPRPRKFSTSMWALIAPFQDNIWFSIALLLIVSILVILLTKWLPRRQRHFIIGGQMNRTPILNMLAVVIGSMVPNPRMGRQQNFGVFARTLFIFWVFFWLIVRNSYQGSLFTFLQSQRENSPYDTVKKVQMSSVAINLMRMAGDLLPDEFDRSR